MKALFATLTVFGAVSTMAAAHGPSRSVEGKSCNIEGRRAYIVNAKDPRNDDVYVCERGAWKFLYTREWDERD